ncbi:hypothetical protein L4X63_03415 [Geomonas sp. Red32]|uniref:hypothetical protein n=1 Tax=Geomonas sp. Red32 TaxID=2912856 RepID=UPI00202CC9C3|nr:hypothetical protein [Geomonas sp. Red32]MCM0080633.1 hypothetical protein [Geomonas sp. Red32]
MIRPSLMPTLQLMFRALLPSKRDPVVMNRRRDGVSVICPATFGKTMDPLLDDEGNFRVLFPGCMEVAGPLVLFRLKRQGYSRCRVKATEEGLYLEGSR